jgi:hypothetical protein
MWPLKKKISQTDFRGDGFDDKTDANPGVLGEQDEEGDDTQMDESFSKSSWTYYVEN